MPRTVLDQSEALLKSCSKLPLPLGDPTQGEAKELLHPTPKFSLLDSDLLSPDCVKNSMEKQSELFQGELLRSYGKNEAEGMSPVMNEPFNLGIELWKCTDKP